MSALDRLAGLLRNSPDAGARPLPVDSSIDAVISRLERQTKSGFQAAVPEDLQQQAVRRFWDLQRFENLKDARLVSFGMCVPSRPSGPCIMEDRQRFQAVLDRQSGVDQWLDEPRWYRRCYQGLVRSYFTYDPKAEAAPSVGRRNWGDLRDYLHERTQNIVDKKVNPDWVTTAVENRQLFSEEPCAPYAEAVLSGDNSAVDLLCERLGVIKASWFLRELVLAQVKQATKLGHERFKDLIPSLVELLASNQVLRDRGLILILDRYAAIDQPAINQPLRDAAVDWWGNPWLPSNEMRWGGVMPAAREMVSEWLKREFIEAFFTKLAEDGVGDQRRANFWLRYVKSMDNIQFALGATALYSRDRDFVALRQKMHGLFTELKTTDSSNNAFVMTMGNLVAVEFGGMGNAFYGYDTRRTLPFDLSQPVLTAKNVRNSLKHSQRILWMQHQDGIRGFDRWEEMFGATLKQEFGITGSGLARRAPTGTVAYTPSLAVPHANSQAPSRSSSAFVGAFSKAALHAYASARNLSIRDLSDRHGAIWVLTNDSDVHVNKVLLDWKFKYKSGKGWWK